MKYREWNPVGEDNETKGNHSTTSEDSLELRIKELEEELATANHCWKECSDRLDWLEDRIAPENAGKSKKKGSPRYFSASLVSFLLTVAKSG